MLNAENKRLCWALLAKYGVLNQYFKIIEECAELTEAASHILQGDGNKANFHEELIDVIVVCQQHLLNDGISTAEINERARAKILRALGGSYAHTPKKG